MIIIIINKCGTKGKNDKLIKDFKKEEKIHKLHHVYLWN